MNEYEKKLRQKLAQAGTLISPYQPAMDSVTSPNHRLTFNGDGGWTNPPATEFKKAKFAKKYRKNLKTRTDYEKANKQRLQSAESETSS